MFVVVYRREEPIGRVSSSRRATGRLGDCAHYDATIRVTYAMDLITADAITHTTKEFQWPPANRAVSSEWLVQRSMLVMGLCHASPPLFAFRLCGQLEYPYKRLRVLRKHSIHALPLPPFHFNEGRHLADVTCGQLWCLADVADQMSVCNDDVVLLIKRLLVRLAYRSFTDACSCPTTIGHSADLSLLLLLV
jgi:hypothetical protein